MNLNHSHISASGLSVENIRFYKDSGYLVASELLSPADIDLLKEETAAIFRGERGLVDGIMPIGTLSDEENLKRYIAIHFPHKISSLIKDFISHPSITAILTKIISANVKCMQSMLFVKAPGKAGQSWHQDEYYIPTRDKSLTGVWIAIDDATEENGCLWIIPGSNVKGYLYPRIKNLSAEYADVDTVDVSAFQQSELIPLEVKKGSVVFFNGYTLHASKKNHTKDCFRTALVNHYMSAESMLPWDQDGKLEASEDLRDIMMVAGKDPYAYKGTIDVNRPYLRPETLKIKTS
ncbi:phytanoyl-CoA dioxygenase family protein [Pedobacter aquatilis]|uniref:phytanoyl-CoA dioxygenase family protein n=1 Tax=Pedobacter aquatilis TaxID=351343 RepID=UPI00292CBAFB|nr:phytanoyl-CoA dioxygenase family protein [Pedobacter aquatilis]